MLLTAGTLATWWTPQAVAGLDWRRASLADEPWRWWTAAFVHWSGPHLAANAAGLAALGVFAAAARVSRADAVAWAAAWPAAHGLLLAAPPAELVRYGGLSGVLHAGVAVAALSLLRTPPGAAAAAQRRAVGLLVLAGLATKLLLESPWGPVLRPSDTLAVSVVPLAHLGGTLAGLLCGALATAAAPRRARP